jgi:hypothetical protein
MPIHINDRHLPGHGWERVGRDFTLEIQILSLCKKLK